MATTEHTPRSVVVLARVLCAAVIASLATGAGGIAHAGRESRSSGSGSATVASAARPQAVRGRYGWPVKPFRRQHPVRGFFNDPRVGRHGGFGFHFGIDIAAPDGTPVYAVAAGCVHLSSGRAVSVVAPKGSVVFGYWHIIPVVMHLERVRTHQLLGYVNKGEGHVHFAERRGGNYVNPLRQGALAPYVDATPPTVRSIELLPSAAGIEIQADAFDTTRPRVPGAWADLPVTPVLLEWRLAGANVTDGGWRIAVDFRHQTLERSRFFEIYGDGTRQNHRWRPGVYLFRIATAWQPEPGEYLVDVRATDTGGNAATLSRAVTIHRDDPLRTARRPSRRTGRVAPARSASTRSDRRKSGSGNDAASHLARP
jgi:hypothetical protein